MNRELIEILMKRDGISEEHARDKNGEMKQQIQHSSTIKLKKV